MNNLPFDGDSYVPDENNKFDNLPFAADTYVPDEFLKLKNKFDVEIAVETGSNNGATTRWLAENFDTVYTIEINILTLNLAKEYCQDFNNVVFLNGSTIDLIEGVVSTIKDKKTIFF